jgi:hypothetical protein
MLFFRLVPDAILGKRRFPNETGLPPRARSNTKENQRKAFTAKNAK